MIATGQAVLVPHIDHAAHRAQVDGPQAAITAELRMHSGLIVALRVHGVVIGALSLGR